jgi:hypothetical protein
MTNQELNTAVLVSFRVAQLSLLSQQAAKAIDEVKFAAYENALTEAELSLLNEAIEVLDKITQTTRQRDCISLIKNL